MPYFNRRRRWQNFIQQLLLLLSAFFSYILQTQCAIIYYAAMPIRPPSAGFIYAIYTAHVDFIIIGFAISARCRNSAALVRHAEMNAIFAKALRYDALRRFFICFAAIKRAHAPISPSCHDMILYSGLLLMVMEGVQREHLAARPQH